MKQHIIALIFLVLILNPTSSALTRLQTPLNAPHQKRFDPRQIDQVQLAQIKSKLKNATTQEPISADECLEEYEECKSFSDEVFEEFDSDQSGFVDMHEFSYVATYVSGIFLLPLPSEEDMAMILDCLDGDASGDIDKNEFFELFLAVLDEMSKQGPGPGCEEGGDGANLLHRGVKKHTNKSHKGHSKRTNKQKRMLNHTLTQLQNRARAKSEFVPGSVDDCFNNYTECEEFSNDIFDEFDTDETGFITTDEFGYVATFIEGVLNAPHPLSPPQIQEIFFELDWDESGDVDKDEFFKLILIVLDQLDAQNWSPSF